MRNLSRTVVNSMIYFTVALTGLMIMILFTNIYYISVIIYNSNSGLEFWMNFFI